jgi:hypothetical protein
VAVSPNREFAFPTRDLLRKPGGAPEASVLVGVVGNVRAVPAGYQLVTQTGHVVVFARKLTGRP